MTLYKKRFGKKGEGIAADYLIDRGFDIIEENFRSKFGEIDIVARKGNKLYFVEVKTRANRKRGMPYEAVNKRKIHQIKKAATYYLLENDKYKDFKYAISVISILMKDGAVDKLQFFENIDLW